MSLQAQEELFEVLGQCPKGDLLLNNPKTFSAQLLSKMTGLQAKRFLAYDVFLNCGERLAVLARHSVIPA